MEFTPITTQEAFDAAIGERLKRERETISKRYGDYDDLKAKVTSYEKQIGDLTRERDENAAKYAGYDKTLADLQKQIKGHETTSVKMRIAHETGVPFELAQRLTGETEEEIRKDAEAIAKFVSKSEPPAGRKSSESTGTDPKTAAFKQMLQNMKGE